MDVRLPPPQPPTDRLLKAVEDFYKPESESKPRNLFVIVQKALIVHGWCLTILSCAWMEKLERRAMFRQRFFHEAPHFMCSGTYCVNCTVQGILNVQPLSQDRGLSVAL